MEIPPIGWLLLVIGPILLVIRPRKLYIVTLFFLPFTATAVINVGSADAASALQASMFLGTLLILRHAVKWIRNGLLPSPLVGRGSLIALGLFIVTTAISLAMPLWIDGRDVIPAERLFDLSSTPLYLTSHNVTGVLYMVFGFLFSYLIAVVNQNPKTFYLSIKCFVAGSVFASWWAAVEFACKVSGIAYPAALFNTSASLSATGYMQTSGEFSRLSSVSVEPSILSQTLLIAIVLYLPYLFRGKRLFGKSLDRTFFLLMLAVLCLSTSSTAYLGLALILVIVLGFLVARGLLKIKHLIPPVSLAIATALLYVAVPAVQQILDNALFSKSEGGSALERLMTITNSYQMFLKYPILGIGWASITSHDLIVDILANSGLAGLATFSGAIFLMFRQLHRSIDSRPTPRRAADLMEIDFAIWVALAITLITSAVSGFLNTFTFFWFILGLSVAQPASQLVDRLWSAQSPVAVQQTPSVPIP